MFSENPGSYEKFIYVPIQGNYYRWFKLFPLYVWLSPVFWSLPFAVYDNLSFKYQLGGYTGDYDVGL